KTRRHNIAWMWMIVALAGAGAIMVLPRGSSTRMIFPCGLMAAYLWYAHRQESRDMEKVADSVYFLGFLWTLFALTHSLIITPQGGPGIRPGDVFAIFGYALVTTGFGMFLRMAVLQFRYTLPDQLTDAQEDFARRVQRFNEEVEATCESLKQFRDAAIVDSRVVVQRWGDIAAATRDGIERATSEALAATRTATEQVATEVEASALAVRQASTAMSGVARSTSSLTKRLEANQERWTEILESGATSVSGAMHDWVARINEAGQPSEVLKHNIDQILRPASLSITGAMKEIETASRQVVDATDTWSQRVKAVEAPPTIFKEQVAHVLQPIAASATDLAAQLHGAALTAVQVREELGRTPDAVRNLSAQLANTSRDLSEFGQALARQREAAQSFWAWFRNR
ncbi:MAG TPA: hypothetical protein VKB91_01055, partial [Gemmatimonadaceae bacterium]|nr:hypothetical protein [Gemmatimonadaceae bacterium]